jgi:hypothetical protein
MAEKLKRDYDVIVLKTELFNVRSGAPNVRFTLQCKVDGELQDAQKWEADTQLIGFTGRSDSSSIERESSGVTLPHELVEELRAWFESETQGDRPLWVHLVRPYGPLRFVPWERVLGDALKVPVLMLPDFIFPPPREVTSVLDIVLCGSAPLGHEDRFIYESVRLAAQRILEAALRRTRLHVFVDAQLVDALRNEWHASGQLNTTIFVYESERARKYVEPELSSRLLDQTGKLRSPWLLWMRDALRGRSVDVLHFVCHGYLSRDQGAMLFAQSPLERTDRFLAGPVGATELLTFLTQVGAWSTVFTAVPDNNSDAGLRALADEIAQTRPGPLMMQTMALDPDCVALADGYQFLYSTTPRHPPRSTALFIYCQPYLDPAARPATRPATGVRNPRGGVMPELTRNAVQRAEVERAHEGSPLDPLFLGNDNVSSSVASTERFAEQVQLRFQQFARDEVLPASVRDHHAHLVMDTVDKIRSAVAAETMVQGPPGVAASVQLRAVVDDDRGETGSLGGAA